MWREIRRENNKGRKGPSPHLVLIAHEGEKHLSAIKLSVSVDSQRREKTNSNRQNYYTLKNRFGQLFPRFKSNFSTPILYAIAYNSFSLAYLNFSNTSGKRFFASRSASSHSHDKFTSL